MKYAKHRSQLKRRPTSREARSKTWMWIVVGLMIVFVLGAVVRSKTRTEPVEAELETALQEIVEEKTDVVEGVEEPEQITLTFVGESGEGSAVARRGTSGDLFTHVVVAQLPPIDTATHFYEGWLVKPGVTQFFSTGEMFPRADGKWGLVWEVRLDDARDDLLDYSKVVITLEPRDGDPAPAPEHVLEGTF